MYYEILAVAFFFLWISPCVILQLKIEQWECSGQRGPSSAGTLRHMLELFPLGVRKLDHHCGPLLVECGPRSIGTVAWPPGMREAISYAWEHYR